MTWAPAPRPEWVRAVNAGTVAPIAEVARLPFDRDSLLGAARARLGMANGGIADFGDEGFVEPLDILLPALEEEAELTLVGRWVTRRFLLRLLQVRLQIVAYVRAHAAVRDEVIQAPIFVTGTPRSGTSILHAALAQDPDNRAPKGWELLHPVPPPEPVAFDTDPRIPLADRELRLFSLIVAGFDAIHEYGARMPKECLSAMSFEFRSEEFTTRYNVPTYAAWLWQCDMRPAYDAHKLVLQLLQCRFPRAQWVLKSPVHLHSIPTLLDVYPDARIAVSHRDPLTVLGSLTSLVATLRWAHSDRVDAKAIAADSARRYGSALDALTTMSENGELAPTRTHHGHYSDFVADPVAAVSELYDHFGLSFSRETAQRIREYIVARPQGMHGAHTYSFDDVGLDRDTERSRFARYCESFAVPEEA